LHVEEKMFLIPYVWNARSTFVFEKQRYKVVAASSAGIVYALVYLDG